MEALTFLIILVCVYPTYFFWSKYEHEKQIKEMHWQQIEEYKRDRDFWKACYEILDEENNEYL